MARIPRAQLKRVSQDVLDAIDGTANPAVKPAAAIPILADAIKQIALCVNEIVAHLSEAERAKESGIHTAR